MILRSIGLRGDVFSPVHPRDPQLAAMFGAGARSAAGVSVTAETAMQSVAVYACVRLICRAMKQTPLYLYRRIDTRTNERAINHPLFHLLECQPNRFQTAAEWKEMKEAHLLLRGAAYSEILSTGSRGVAELIPLHPDRVRPFWAPDGQRAYAYNDPSGGTRVILQSEMLHVMELSFDGLNGVTPIKYLKNAIGLDLAQEEFAGSNIANGARPAGVLQSDKEVGPDGITNLRKQWEEMHSGARNVGRIAVLEDGMKWEQIGLSLEDAEFLDSRKFSVTQIARIFGVPPHKIGDLDRATFSNIEQQSLEFVQDTMMPHFVSWQEAIRRDLLGPSEQRDFFAKFDANALTSADVGARRNMYTAGRQWGWMSANDVRTKEGDNPVDGGDVYLQPTNMGSTGAAGLPDNGGGDEPLTADKVQALIQEALDARANR